MEWSPKVSFEYGPAGACFLCGGETVKWLRPEFTGGSGYVATHIACAAKVLIAFVEWQQTGKLTDQQQAWLSRATRPALTAGG